jgi:mono/diheme cytochrome c family protein
MRGSSWLDTLRRPYPLALLVLLLVAGAVVSRPAGFASTVVSGMPRPAQRPAIPEAVAAGALDFVTFGCENCHGLSGRGGVRVPNISGQATIPALNTPTIRSTLSAGTLRYFIQHGVVLKSSRAQVYMPVWGAVMSNQQVSDLVAYIRAAMPRIAGVTPQPVRIDLGLRVEGQQLFIRYGCVVCHAFNGFGGVPNPSSPDKTIPPLRGRAFDKQFTKDSDIAYVIKHGSILGGPPIVSMPVWSGLLSDQQIKALVAYIRSFH